jgi:hypothetical protein
MLRAAGFGTSRRCIEAIHRSDTARLGDLPAARKFLAAAPSPRIHFALTGASQSAGSGAIPAYIAAVRTPVATQRAVVDYGLARRAALHDLRAGRSSQLDVCDAHPYLLRAAKFHGETTERDCPVCAKEQLVEVTYTYGDCFKEATNGRVRQRGELPELAHEFAEFTVYVVEVCQSCAWNHLTLSYVLGTADPHETGARVTPNGESTGSTRRRRAAEE